MKKHFYKYCMIAVVMLMASCGKDVVYSLPDGDKYSNLYMPQATNHPLTSRLFMVAEEQMIHYSAFYSGYDAPNDINIKFEIRPELVAKYNEENGTDYKSMPAGSWHMESTSGFIPKGECTTELMDITINTFGHIEPFTEYMLPLVMTSDDIKINEDLATLYYVISAAYEPGNVPSVLVCEDKDKAIADALEIFSFNDKCLIARGADGKVLRYGYDSTNDLFGTPETLFSDWNTGLVKMISKGPGTSVQVCNMYDTWISYEWGENATPPLPAYSGYTSVITGGTFIFRSVIPNCPDGLLAVVAADNSLRWYKMSNDGHSLANTSKDTNGFNFANYVQLFYYGKDLIGIDKDGDMWHHPVNSDNSFTTNPIQVGSGWEDFTHVIPFGTDLLARTKDGRLYKYAFDLRGFWALK
ncbi:MAG: DUF1735 domain-containing protein [Bacteroidales bacterium]|nr:DUF1735 domain-containing protein [Bacteroidales bacterium]